MLTFFWTNKTGCQTMVIHIKVHTECSGFWHLVVLEIEIVLQMSRPHNQGYVPPPLMQQRIQGNTHIVP